MSDALQDLIPPEVREVMEQSTQAEAKLDASTLANLALHVTKLRDAAVKARKESGVEDEWRYCEEAYIGIDDENRGEFSGARWAKPMNMEGGLRSTATRGNSTDEVRAKAFIRITARYVDAGHAKMCETALPLDGKPFTLKATPVPELGALKENQTPASIITGRQMQGPDGRPLTVGDLASNEIRLAEEAATKATDQIHDWLVECQHVPEVRKVVFDGARIGTGVLKGPVPVIRRGIKAKRMGGGRGQVVGVEIVEATKPATQWVDTWNFFPAPGCGEDIQNGGHCFELDTMLPQALAKLARNPAYLKEQIAVVMEQGPANEHRDEATEQRRLEHNGADHYTVWHFYGEIPRSAFKVANPKQDKELAEHLDAVFCMVTLVNDIVIRVTRPPMDSDRLPFHVFRWSRRAGSWTGIGVAEQIRTPQRIINAAWRRLLNNAGQSSGSQVVMDPTKVEPANGQYGFHPDKVWWLKQDSGITDVRQVFQAFQWPNTTPQMLAIIEAGYRLAEEHTSIPLITQGQSGDTTPDTFSGQQLQDNNANQLLRRVGGDLNDQVTTGLIDMCYEWLLIDPDVPNEAKGDFQVDTSGALAIIEKKLEAQMLPQLVQASLNPAFDLHPGRTMEAWMRSRRLVPSQFQLTEDEKKARAEQPPPKPPQVMSAEIQAQARLEAAKITAQVAQTRMAVDVDRDTKNVQAQTERTAMEREAQLRELLVRERLATLQYATQQQISIDRAKVELAKLTMELNAQFKLAGDDGKGPQVAEPMVEPEGRAPEGEAFQR